MWLLLQKTEVVTKQSFELDIELAAHVLLLCCLNHLRNALTNNGRSVVLYVFVMHLSCCNQTYDAAHHSCKKTP